MTAYSFMGKPRSIRHWLHYASRDRPYSFMGKSPAQPEPAYLQGLGLARATVWPS
jgi:hypothetical protein